jgi:hypothetical protein
MKRHDGGRTDEKGMFSCTECDWRSLRPVTREALRDHVKAKHPQSGGYKVEYLGPKPPTRHVLKLPDPDEAPRKVYQREWKRRRTMEV